MNPYADSSLAVTKELMKEFTSRKKKEELGIEAMYAFPDRGQ